MMLKFPWCRPARREIECAHVVLYGDRAFVPMMGKSNFIGWREMEPVLCCELSAEALGKALEEMIEKGNPRVRHPTDAEMRQRTPVQRAAGVRSWKQLARAGAMGAGIRWERKEGKIKIAFTPRHTNHGMEEDYRDRRIFPIDATTHTLAECILTEWHDRQSGSEKG